MDSTVKTNYCVLYKLFIHSPTHFSWHKSLKKTNPANRSDTEALTILGPASERFQAFLSTGSQALCHVQPLPAGENQPNCQRRTRSNPTQLFQKTHQKQSLKNSHGLIFAEQNRLCAFCPTSNPAPPWDAAGEGGAVLPPLHRHV